jgi:hypothetical protein
VPTNICFLPSQAKKLADVHKEARAELGMLPASMMPTMQSLPALPRGTLAAPAEEVELFPAFKGAGAGKTCQERCGSAGA